MSIFSRITKYDEEYLREKKSDLEELLRISDSFEKWCLEYDDLYRGLKSAYTSSQNKDYIGIALRENNKSKNRKSNEEIISEAINLQQRELTFLRDKIKERFTFFVNEQLFNANAPYHTIFTNVYKAEETKFLYCRAKYRQLNSIEFIKDIKELDSYLLKLKLVYSEFIAKEYSANLDSLEFKFR